MTIEAIQREMAAGRLSSVDLVESYLERIDGLDHHGPELRAVLYTNEEARSIAYALDQERRGGRTRGVLHGVPILFKANINTGDGVPTTAGSLALHGHLAGSDAPLVARLRQSGAVILGKTNMSEWANYRSRRSSSGWSGEGGQTRNPHVLDRNPSGSSSGSAVAVAAGLCALAVGTETDGSIISPSSASGIVGIKPALGMVSQEGIIPISRHQDTAGPMARTLTDAVHLLSAMSEPAALRASGIADWKPGLSSIAGLRLGYAARMAGFHLGVDAIMAEAIHVFENLGATVEDVDLGFSCELREAEALVLRADFRHDLAIYL
jgi:amidase